MITLEVSNIYGYFFLMKYLVIENNISFDIRKAYKRIVLLNIVIEL